MASLYRQAAFLSVGLMNFTRSAFESRAKKFCDEDMVVDLHDRCFMVTGANAGLGRSITASLLKRHATVHMVCRNQERAMTAKHELVQECDGSGEIHVHIVDISSVAQVRAFAKDFVMSNHQLHCLVNNAGCMVHERTQTDEGFDVNFATNILGTFLLTNLLREKLNECSTLEQPSRVITVSSGGMLTQNLNLDDIQSMNYSATDATYVYAHQKRQQVALTEFWADNQGVPPKIHYQSVHPGWADTPGVRSAIPDFNEKMGNRMRSSDQGADGILWLAISKHALQFPSGEFFLDRSPQSKHLPLAWTKYDRKRDPPILHQKIQEIVDKIPK